MRGQFWGKSGDLESRLRAIEHHLRTLGLDLTPAMTGASGFSSPAPPPRRRSGGNLDIFANGTEVLEDAEALDFQDDDVDWTGSVTGDTAEIKGRVVKIQSYAVQNVAPADGEALVWVDANSQYEPTAGSGLGGTHGFTLGAWARESLNNLPTGAADELFNPWTHSGALGNEDRIGNLFATAGTIRELAVLLTGDIGGSDGDTLTITVYKNGVATAAAVTITASGGTDDRGTWTGNIAFAANDLITCYGIRSASLAGAISIHAVVRGTLDF